MFIFTPDASTGTVTGGVMTTTSSECVVQGSGNDEAVFFKGWVEISTTAGNVVLQWAQGTSDGGSTFLRANSWMELTKLS
jgi:hypothetical protein